jgi:hypothetical protein
MRFDYKFPVHSPVAASNSIGFEARCNLDLCTQPDSASHFHYWNKLQVLALGCSPSTATIDPAIKSNAD